MHDEGPDKATDATHMWTQASRYGAVGIEMAAAVAMGAVAGHWLDQRYQTEPWGILAGFGIGLGAAVKAVMHVIGMHRRDT